LNNVHRFHGSRFRLCRSSILLRMNRRMISVIVRVAVWNRVSGRERARTISTLARLIPRSLFDRRMLEWRSCWIAESAAPSCQR
jgi:hypothetical protein